MEDRLANLPTCDYFSQTSILRPRQGSSQERKKSTQLKTDAVHVEEPVEKMQAVPNRPQKANG